MTPLVSRTEFSGSAALETMSIVADFFLFPWFSAWFHHCMTCYNSLFMCSVWVRSCFGSCSVKRRPRSPATNLPGSVSWQHRWTCAAQSLSPRHTERQTHSPNLSRVESSRAGPGCGIVNVHSTMLLLSVLSSAPSQQHSNLKSGLNQFGECIQGWEQF